MNRRRLGTKNYWPLVILGLPLLFLFFFFYLPVLLVFIPGISGGTGGSAASGAGGDSVGAAAVRMIASPYYRRLIGFTVVQALLSTLGAVLLGFPGGWILGRFRFPGKNFIRSLTSIPFVLPSILVVLGFVLFFGNQGHVNRFFMNIFNLETPPFKILYSFKAIILAHSFYNFPVIMRTVAASCGGLSQSQHDCARSLGAGGWRLFRTITLPQLLPGLLAGAALVFLFCFMSFAIVLVLGGGPRYSTIEVEIYRLAKVSLNFTGAAGLGFWGLCGSMGLLFLTLVLQKRAAVPTGGGGLEPKSLGPVFRRPANIFILLYLALCLTVLLGPLISVALNSLQMKARDGGTLWSLKWYAQFFGVSGGSGTGTAGAGGGGISLRAAGNSLYFGGLTVLTALPLGCLVAFRSASSSGPRGRLEELLLMLPMGVSSVLLGVGYLKLMGLAGLDVRGSRLVILGAHTVIAYPFVARTISAAVRNIPPELLQAASSLGAGPARVLLGVRLPLIKNALLTGAAFAFSLSLGEINATLLLAAPDQITIPLAMNRLIGSYNLYGACVLGTILMVLCGLAFFIIDRFGEKQG